MLSECFLAVAFIRGIFSVSKIADHVLISNSHLHIAGCRVYMLLSILVLFLHNIHLQDWYTPRNYYAYIAAYHTVETNRRCPWVSFLGWMWHWSVYYASWWTSISGWMYIQINTEALSKPFQIVCSCRSHTIHQNVS